MNFTNHQASAIKGQRKFRNFFFCFLIGSVFSVYGQEPMLGEVRIFAGNFAPNGWAFCDGQILPIVQHQSLFSLLGTTYGGDGRTTFALPDLRGRAPIHEGSGPGLTPRPLGTKVGAEQSTLNTSHLPAHTHEVVLQTDSTVATSDQPKGNFLGRNAASTPQYGTTANSTLDTTSVKVSSTGSGGAFSNMQPSLALNYIIALTGVFPSPTKSLSSTQNE